MPGHTPRLLLALACCLAAVAVAPAAVADCAASDTTCRQLQQAKQSQAAANQQLQQIEASLTDAQQKADQTLALLSELDGEVTQQRALIAQTKARLSDAERRVRFTAAQIERQQAHLDVREGLLGQRLRALDKQGGFDYVELVVTARSFTELVDRLVVLQDIVRSDQRLVDGLRRERDRLHELQAVLVEQRAEVAALLDQQEVQEAQLEEMRAQQQAALSYYQQLEAQYAAQRAELEAEKAQIDALVGQLQAQYDAEARSVGGGSGRFAWPLRGPITQMFGCTDLLGEPYDPNCPSRHFHTGIDIAADLGTPVGAADAGVVSFVNLGWGGGYGNFIMITHGNGYATLYAHLSAVYVQVGQEVQRGQVIGAEGSTGYSTGPHLHFEIRYNGSYENPLSYVA